MPAWILDTVKALIPGIIIACLASILTVRLAIRRFHEEKWWEKKQEMYSRLLEILHHLKKYASEHYEGQFDSNYITDEKRLLLTYQASDCLVIPSLEDLGPLTAYESILCGVPVVMFNTGSSEDIIINGKTGFSVDKYDFQALANSIYKILKMTPIEKVEISQFCRSFGMSNFSSDNQFDSIINAYKIERQNQINNLSIL